MKCPHCKKSYTKNNYRFHLRSVRMIGGENKCSSLPGHPNHKKNRETNNFLASYAAPPGVAGYPRA